MSKLILYDWRCTGCQTKFEDMAKSDVKQIPCPECGEVANRLIACPRLDPRMGLDPEGNPTMGDKWAKVREQRARIEKAHYKEHGTNLSAGSDVQG